tara:strand:+ start:460 stop:570 length:111 start_codon:yes stop_codon:yes gene_type:complete
MIDEQEKEQQQDEQPNPSPEDIFVPSKMPITQTEEI